MLWLEVLMFKLENRKARTPVAKFGNNERSKQMMLLSGLDCLPGQLDLFDVDSFPKETADEHDLRSDFHRSPDPHRAAD